MNIERQPLYSGDSRVEAVLAEIEATNKPAHISGELFVNLEDWLFEVLDRVTPLVHDLLAKSVGISVCSDLSIDFARLVKRLPYRFAVDVLVNLSDLPIEERLQILHSLSVDGTLLLKNYAIQELAKVSPPGVESYLGGLLLSEGPDVMESCVSALDYLGTPEALGYLVQFYDTRDSGSPPHQAAFDSIKEICRRFEARLSPTPMDAETAGKLQEFLQARSSPLHHSVSSAMSRLIIR